MLDVATELLKLKQEIDEAKAKRARLEGKLSSLMDRLKGEFECKDVKTAGKLLTSLSEEMAEMESRLEEGVSQMRERYG